MTLADLIRRFRVLVKDTAKGIGSDGSDMLWADEDIIDWLNDGQDQACMRGRLITEDANPSICEIAMVTGTRTYALHKTVLEIIHAQLERASGEVIRLSVVSREWLDRRVPDWRTRSDLFGYAIQNETTLTVLGAVSTGDKVRLECSRLPLKRMENDMDKPEIHPASHVHLLEWAIHKAYSIPDTDTFDPGRSEKAGALFTQHFGFPVDRDLLRDTRKDEPQHNVAIFP